VTRRIGVIAAGLAVLAMAVLAWLLVPWFSAAQVQRDTAFIVPDGATLASAAAKLEKEGLIGSADSFLLRAKLLGGGGHIQAGEFLLPAGASQFRILDVFQSGEVVRRFVTVPEGMPSILVHERLMAEPLLTGQVAVPAEGSVLPDTYSFERGETRQAVLNRMQAAMKEALAEEWAKRGPRTMVETPQQAVILASVVEKETGKASERPMVAGALSNRLRTGMRLDADATTIYPITRGKPLGRLIRVSELRDSNPYNTRAIGGLPAGPITNPGRDAIRAVLNPAETDAVFYVADGTGGHVFARTLAEHNANVAKWRQIRREKGI
jgi:UPF0755 protein